MLHIRSYKCRTGQFKFSDNRVVNFFNYYVQKLDDLSKHRFTVVFVSAAVHTAFCRGISQLMKMLMNFTRCALEHFTPISSSSRIFPVGLAQTDNCEGGPRGLYFSISVGFSVVSSVCVWHANSALLPCPSPSDHSALCSIFAAFLSVYPFRNLFGQVGGKQ